MQAVCCRYLRRFDEARAALLALKNLAPEYGRAHQEEGHLMRDCGEFTAAVSAYRRACRCNPALVAAWRSLADCLDRLGANAAEATAARRQADALRRMPQILVSATDLISQGRLARAEKILRRFLLQAPRHVEGMRLLAAIGMKLGVLDDAEYLLESACAFEPEHVAARVDYIQALTKRQKHAAARAQAKGLLEKYPNDPRFQSIYAMACMGTGDFDEALSVFGEVLKVSPRDAAALTSRGHAYKTMGGVDAAVRDYRAALAAAPTSGEAYYALANLKTYRFREAEVTALRRQHGNVDLPFMDRVYVSFAYAKACEDRGEFARAFECYAKGNRLKKTQSRYSAAAISAEFAAQQAVCDAAFFAARRGYGHKAPDPIFIVGLPRAGSTLLEQILSSHSMVDGTLELPNVLTLAHRLRRGARGAEEKIAEEVDGKPGQKQKYPAVLARLGAADFAGFGKAYIEDTMMHRRGAPFFIDKMPNNFRHIGLIALMLPNAKIIDARRHAMACCFSGFRQLFAEGQEFSYALADIGAYYRDYVELMRHWNRVLPGRILTVRHEDVVHDLEAEVRRMLDYCGLPFEPACLEYHKTARNIRTPSSEQVRRPIFRSGLDSWKNFEPWLGPLKAALGAELLAEQE